MVQALTANETMVILEIGHGKHLVHSMFLNHLYNTERVFPNHIQMASPPLAFLPFASLPTAVLLTIPFSISISVPLTQP